MKERSRHYCPRSRVSSVEARAVVVGSMEAELGHCRFDEEIVPKLRVFPVPPEEAGWWVCLAAAWVEDLEVSWVVWVVEVQAERVVLGSYPGTLGTMCSDYFHREMRLDLMTLETMLVRPARRRIRSGSMAVERFPHQ